MGHLSFDFKALLSTPAFRELVLRGFANSRGRPEPKMHHLNPSMSKGIKTVQQLQQSSIHAV
jgi:hypothetical protein